MHSAVDIDDAVGNLRDATRSIRQGAQHRLADEDAGAVHIGIIDQEAQALLKVFDLARLADEVEARLFSALRAPSSGD